MAKRKEDCKYSISLCVYKSENISDCGHAFITMETDGIVVIAVGLSPAALPKDIYTEIKTILPTNGKIYSEFDSLKNKYLKKKTWNISLNQHASATTKINRDRSNNVCEDIPNMDGTPADKMVEIENDAFEKGEEWSGGPSYTLLWQNCANYALEVLDSAGIKEVSEMRNYINTPAHLIKYLS